MRDRRARWAEPAGFGVATAAIACGVWMWLGATTTWRPIEEATAERELRGVPWARAQLVYSAVESSETNHSGSRTMSGSLGNLRIERSDSSSEMTDSSSHDEVVELPGSPPIDCASSTFSQPPGAPSASHLVFRASPGRRVLQFRCAIDQDPCLDERGRDSNPLRCADARRILSLAADASTRWPWVFGRLHFSPGRVAEDHVTLPKLRVAGLALALATVIELLALARTLVLLARRRPPPAEPPPYRGSAPMDPSPDAAPRWHRWHWLGASSLAALAAWLIRDVS